MAETTSEQWWITTDATNRPHRKLLGPFESSDLALRVRSLFEKVEGGSYWVDTVPSQFAAGAPDD